MDREAGDTAGPDSYASNVGIPELVLFVTYAHLRNPLLSVSTEIHMKCGAGAVNGSINLTLLLYIHFVNIYFHQNIYVIKA